MNTYFATSSRPIARIFSLGRSALIGLAISLITVVVLNQIPLRPAIHAAPESHQFVPASTQASRVTPGKFSYPFLPVILKDLE